jgi:hypothetical protein
VRPGQLDAAELSRHPPVIPCELPDGLQFVYLDDRGRRRTIALEEAGAIDFGQTRSLRQPPAYRRQRNFPGWWWSATTRSHVVYESWLERHHIIEADRDARVTGIAGQPFGLTWPVERSQALYVPDIFCRTFDGGGALTDCHAVDKTDAKFMQNYTVTAAACQVIGWEFRLVGETDPVWASNIRGTPWPTPIREIDEVLGQRVSPAGQCRH